MCTTWSEGHIQDKKHPQTVIGKVKSCRPDKVKPRVRDSLHRLQSCVHVHWRDRTHTQQETERA